MSTALPGPEGPDLPGPIRTRPTYEVVDQRVDLRLAGDIDAARRLVEHEHVDVVVQQARDRDLLLIASREARYRLRRGPAARMPETFDPHASGLRCADGDTKKPGPRPFSRVSVMLSAMLRFVASPSPCGSR